MRYIALLLMMGFCSIQCTATDANTSWGSEDKSTGIAPDPLTAVVVSGQLRALQMDFGDASISIPWRKELTLYNIIHGFGGFSDFAGWVSIAEPGKASVIYRFKQIRDEAIQKSLKIAPGSKIHFGWIS